MIRKLSLTATMLAAALTTGRPACAIDPVRTPTGNPQVPQPIDPYTNPYLPGISIGGSVIPGTSVYPGGTTLPPGLQNDSRNRVNDPLSSIPGGVSPDTGDFSAAVNGTSRVAPQYLPPGQTVPPQTQQPSKWRLGVYSKDTDAGVRIIQVVRGSAAERAGLEANDVIVCVAGYQVGYVGGVPYDCAYEFERNADADGWVSLLVQNNRDSKLMPLPLQLDSRYSRIDGNITYRENYPLPQGAMATVELRETLRPGAPAVTIARKEITNLTTTPIRYVLDYDPSLIDNRRTYALHATITSGTQTLFATRSTIPVINNGSLRNVPVLVESTGAGSPYADRNRQIEQIVTWFRTYLGREPRALELAAWQAHIDRGGSINDAQVQILSMPEFYNKADASDVTYIRELHKLILNKEPTQQELAYWMNRVQANNRLRPEVAREFLAAVGVQR
ncbi:MAG: YbaY family lipoprotein [Planctomycetaceae bacterium]|nr:YbaY family lipoprotein [Planctomycetaceae bacterium]